MHVIVSPAARADLAGIWDDTVAAWGETQAVTYVRIIEAAFNTLVANPRSGRRCDEIRAGYRRYSVGSHIIFYRVDRGVIDVVRVLHGRMDVARRL